MSADLPKLQIGSHEGTEHDLVFTTRAGTGHDHRNIAGRVLRRAVTRAALGAVVRNGTVVQPAPTFHTFRHSHASALIAPAGTSTRSAAASATPTSPAPSSSTSTPSTPPDAARTAAIAWPVCTAMRTRPGSPLPLDLATAQPWGGWPRDSRAAVALPPPGGEESEARRSCAWPWVSGCTTPPRSQLAGKREPLVLTPTIKGARLACGARRCTASVRWLLAHTLDDGGALRAAVT